jgi:hypothetical protein
VTLGERLRDLVAAAAAPKCLNGTRRHVAGEHDPNGGVWCAVCGKLVPGTAVQVI